MSFITLADSYIEGYSNNWKNWQAKYKEPKTCLECEENHGKIYPFDALSYIPKHIGCRCIIVPMRTKQVGTATKDGWNGADVYLMYYGHLPDNYITKEEAINAGWKSWKHNLQEVCPGKIIGNVPYNNNESKLPSDRNRKWFEADFDYDSEYRGKNRILYSNDGLIFVSYDHAQTFYELVK